MEYSYNEQHRQPCMRMAQSYDTVKPRSRNKRGNAHASFAEEKRPPQCCHGLCPRRYIKEDPTAPHLKYGLFQQPKQKWKPLAKMQNSRSVPIANPIHSGRGMMKKDEHHPACDMIQVEQESNAECSRCSKIEVQAPRKAENSLSPPMFMFRPLKGRPVVDLSISPSTHLDIKPRRLSPIMNKLSPLFTRRSKQSQAQAEQNRTRLRGRGY